MDKFDQEVLSEWSLTYDDLLVLSIYPATVLLGQIVNALGSVPPSYFSSKRNFFNIIFIKRAWLWVTVLAGFKLYEVYNTFRKGKSHALAPYIFALRYFFSTFWWFIFSQWFFGRPLMDRVFVLTGGSCQPGDAFSIASHEVLTSQLASVSSYQCKSMGHNWEGGSDPSGHMFIIAHGSLYLWFEIFLPAMESPHTNPGKRVGLLGKLTGFTLVVFWWMLLMTNIYDFHSFTERLAGLVWGYIEVLAVYIFSRTIPLAQMILI